MSHPAHPAASFSGTQKALHWAVVILLLLQYLVFDGMGRPFDRMIETGIADYSGTALIHMTIGISVLALALWRLSLRRSHGVPPPPAGEPDWAPKLASITTALIYLLLIALPLGGLTAWFAQSETVAELHEMGTNILMALILLHVGAVLMHQFVWKTGLLKRMM